MKITEAGKIITAFIREYIDGNSPGGAVIGLSGGLDSAVTAALAVEALGRDRVDAVSLPYSTSDPCSQSDAEKIARHLGIALESFDITPAVDAIAKNRPGIDRLRLGNICARVRMIYLYDISAEREKLVLGTGNRTERLLGYSTLWGDSACAIAPLGDILKTQERALAREIGLPDWIVEKTPTADLWRGQTDEGELGITYPEADKIIHAVFDLETTREKLIEGGFNKNSIDLVFDKYENSEFKRRMPPYPELPDLTLELP